MHIVVSGDKGEIYKGENGESDILNL